MQLKQKGSSLIEVLIATFVVGVVVTAIASGMSYSVRNTAESRYREAATKLAQDVHDSFRRERNRVGWTQLANTLSTVADNYCFMVIPDQFSAEQLAAMQGICGDADTTTVTGLSVGFLRDVTVNVTGSVITVNVTVSWQSDENRDPSSVELVQELRDWD